MQKLQLHHSGMLQGEFGLQRLNSLFVFQVNCPGCFLYGIPLMNKIFQQFQNRLGILGLSTAFEDFEYNNAENTSLLLSERIIVGETKKAMAKYGHEKYPKSIDFPVAMDVTMDASYPIDKAATQIASKNHEFVNYSKAEQAQILSKIHDYLNQLPKASLTFTLNQFRGTPSFVIFDYNYNIITEWFGHKTEREVFSTIESLISNPDH